ncbi:MAG: DUF4178 domain-containing protein [Armatimonadetes bacterium]|nr:DUF4178 domain-containing protein [Armatimonadota bacterium]
MTEPFALKPGDVVSYAVEDYVVESRIAYSSPRLSWTEWVLNAGETDNRLMLALIDSALYVGKPCFCEGRPGDQMIRVEGRLFALKRADRADASVEYDTGATRFDRAEFWHYLDDSGRLIAIRRGHLGEWALDLTPTDPALFEVYGA